MSFPVHDWQFWVVTTAAALAVGWILWGVLPIGALKRRRARKRQQKRASLTIEGQSVPKDR